MAHTITRDDERVDAQEFVDEHSVENAMRIAEPFLDGFFEGETISVQNADHIAMGIVAIASYMDDNMASGGDFVATIANRLFARFGPKASRIGRHFTDAEIAASVAADHRNGDHRVPVVHCNQCIEDRNDR